MYTEILSVGIDIGTSTTSMVASRLKIENTASRFTVPRISIIDKKIVYKSDIYLTPLTDSSTIDAAKVKQLISDEYRKAQIRPAMIQTGAVIITGESARKENAENVTRELSEFAGDFVVATAGPDLESIIAGRGAGAERYSEEHGCTVANLDIGGGTTNIAVFDRGKLIAKGCADVGGRLLTYDENRRITYISPRLVQLCAKLGMRPEIGMTADSVHMEALTRGMVRALEETLNPASSRELADLMRTAGSFPLNLSDSVKKIDCLSFSGGVADCLYGEETDLYKYGDIGVSLAKSIRESSLLSGRDLVVPRETIRATVVGAGSYTTSISGSTITYTGELFPIKNIPAFVVSEDVERDCLKGDAAGLAESTRWFLEQSQAQNILFCFKGRKTITYDQLCRMAESIVSAAVREIDSDKPLLVLVENDLAKSLGQAIYRKSGRSRDVICIDSVKAAEGDYIDLGKPLISGMVIPLVIKTLIFG